MDKTISEFKIIETDDGFRVEIKGDKEKIRRMLGCFGMHDPGEEEEHSHRGFGYFGPWTWAGFRGFPWWWREPDEPKR